MAPTIRAAQLAAILLVFLACSAPVLALNNVVTQWNVRYQGVVRSLSIANQQSSKYFAELHLAQYYAVLLAAPSGSNASTSENVAVNASAAAAYAGHYILSATFPFQQPNFDALLKSQVGGLSSADRTAAHDLGVKVATKIIAARVNDGSADWYDFTPSPANGTIGKYQFTPNQTNALYPQLQNTRPFLVDPSRFNTTNGGPLTVPSDTYNTQLAEVRTLGSSTSSNRSATQTETAYFWADLAGTGAITSHWYNITAAVLPNSTDVLTTAKVYAAIGVAIYDASIAGWKQKYGVLFWRPITAIRQGDGVNTPDATWSPLLSTPNHPEYPSGHSVTSGAAAGILINHFGSDNTTFTIGSEYTSANVTSLSPRSYTKFTDTATEIGLSRIYGGLHFRKAIEDGQALGLAVASAVWASFPSSYSVDGVSIVTGVPLKN
ncbi:hypothetical protein KFL_000220060 [Klebsormidium nitens]|uniref:Phosphatidic acid phosphatase type 2/haloperoxidase domain-containing protein n=1 Tax=Klebsormidium nitens TaxID=105231 RepID=A0A1Y1HK80_KLENI|nr:hypothetical protein KFL_000220060 [Klebsormidium nitens]|eukprot:GAQ78974.1 hypothetical protein KFL_000220060 [Klebsormidium nitens]